ncbi:MAG: alpha/beta hydrolase family protein [Prevotella sp.]
MKKYLLILCCLIGMSSVQAGTVDTVQVYSKKMNKFIKTIVVTPTRTRASRNSRYPVVYMLHGAYSNCKKWLEIKPTLPDMADAKGMIFVTPDALNSWYFDSPVDSAFRYETFVTKELVTYVDSAYPTIASRTARAITGLSMGGHGALYLAMRHKNLFGACGSMSGGVDIRPFPQNWNLPDVLGEMAQNKKNWDDNTVMNQIGRIHNGDLSIIIDCGESDFFLEVNKELHQRLLGRGIDHDFITRPGAHDNKYWGNSIDYQLLFFEKYFRNTTIQ